MAEAAIKGTFNKATIIRLLKGGLGTPVLILAALAMVVLPMPSWLLDIFFVFNNNMTKLINITIFQRIDLFKIKI